MYLAKDKNTGLCKGFAYVHFYSKEDAAAAIETLDGFGYDHLILKAEWSKPQYN
jgi:translation initiation factor 3 subunit G